MEVLSISQSILSEDETPAGDLESVLSSQVTSGVYSQGLSSHMCVLQEFKSCSIVAVVLLHTCTLTHTHAHIRAGSRWMTFFFFSETAVVKYS